MEPKEIGWNWAPKGDLYAETTEKSQTIFLKSAASQAPLSFLIVYKSNVTQSELLF